MKLINAGCEVIAAVVVTVANFWDKAPCSRMWAESFWNIIKNCYVCLGSCSAPSTSKYFPWEHTHRPKRFCHFSVWLTEVVWGGRHQYFVVIITIRSQNSNFGNFWIYQVISEELATYVVRTTKSEQENKYPHSRKVEFVLWKGPQNDPLLP
jgi:hypothetical protein